MLLRMKLFFLTLGCFGSLITNAVIQSAEAQTGATFGLSQRGTTDLVCNLAKPIGYATTQTTVQAVDGQAQAKIPVFGCKSKTEAAQYQLVLAGVKLDRDAVLSSGAKLAISLHCNVAPLVGTFAYGGETAGFTAKQKFFYGVGENGYGRCYLSGATALISALNLSKASVMAIAPLQSK
jgi:hypothetical protein